MEKVNLNEFDIIGVITLKEVQGIEKYVTPIIEHGKVREYLSRSKEYYNVKTMTELAIERESLSQLLTEGKSKRNFVILENMLNCSGKVYFKKFEQYINSGKNEYLAIQLEQAEKCMMEDVRNLLAIFENQGTIKTNPNNRLPGGSENSQRRAIEMDNKAILYIFAKALKLKKRVDEVEILTPGYGSIYIGPFLKAMYGYEFTNTLKSKYIEETMNSQDTNIQNLMSSDRIFQQEKTVLLLDDNVGTGTTIRELKEDLRSAGITNIICGAIQYNWRNYYKISVGEKTNVDRFNIDEVDILTPINYAGHKLYKHAIDELHSSGADYEAYLNLRSYRRPDYSDIKGALIRGLKSAKKSGLKLSDDIDEYISSEVVQEGEKEILPKYQNGPAEVTNPIQKEMIKRIINIIGEIEKSGKSENLSGEEVEI